MEGDILDRARALCAAVGFDLHSVTPALLARMRLLAERTETVADTERMVARAWDFFRYYQRAKPTQAFSELERRIVVLGCLFSDIGKSGPANADADGQTLITEMFGIEGVRNDKQSVAEFLTAYFPSDAAERVRRFERLGLDSKLTVREFWNLHSAWTLAIAQAGNVPTEVVAAAATHHLLDNVNPDAIVGADRRFRCASGDNTSFDRAEKLIILLDKYDALRRRGRRSHDQAIAWLRARVHENPEFRADEELSRLLGDLDAVFRSH